MSDYKVVKGFIVSPGKFEGEPEWMPDLWDRILGGFSDVSLHDGTTAYDAFRLTDEIAALTGYRARPDTYVVIWSDEKGFISHMTMDQGALDAIESHHESELDFETEEPTLDFIDTSAIVGFDDFPEYESGY